MQLFTYLFVVVPAIGTVAMFTFFVTELCKRKKFISNAEEVTGIVKYSVGHQRSKGNRHYVDYETMVGYTYAGSEHEMEVGYSIPKGTKVNLYVDKDYPDAAICRNILYTNLVVYLIVGIVLLLTTLMLLFKYGIFF